MLGNNVFFKCPNWAHSIEYSEGCCTTCHTAQYLGLECPVVALSLTSTWFCWISVSQVTMICLLLLLLSSFLLGRLRKNVFQTFHGMPILSCPNTRYHSSHFDCWTGLLLSVHLLYFRYATPLYADLVFIRTQFFLDRIIDG